MSNASDPVGGKSSVDHQELTDMAEGLAGGALVERVVRVEAKLDGVGTTLHRVETSVDRLEQGLPAVQETLRREQGAVTAEQRGAHLALANQVATLAQAVAVQTATMTNVASQMNKLGEQVAGIGSQVTELREFRGNVLGRWSVGGAIAAGVSAAVAWAMKHFGG